VTDTLRLVTPSYFDRTVWHEMVRWRLAERTGERNRHAAPPPFPAEICALLHGDTTQGPRLPVPEEQAQRCRFERIAPSQAWDRVVGRRGERQGGAGQSQKPGGATLPAHRGVRGSLDRFL
jgi:hypothetical protein